MQPPPWHQLALTPLMPAGTEIMDSETFRGDELLNVSWPGLTQVLGLATPP